MSRNSPADAQPHQVFVRGTRLSDFGPDGFLNSLLDLSPYGKLHTVPTQSSDYFGRIAEIPAANQPGTLCVGHLQGALGKDMFQLQRIFVHPDYRRRKIGTYLLEAVKQRMIHPCRMIQALVPEHNLELQQLLHASDFALRAILRKQTTVLYRFIYHTQRASGRNRCFGD